MPSEPVRIELIEKAQIDALRAALAAASVDRDARLRVLAEVCRFNTLAAVKRAGSGHLGTSLSAMDVVCLLYFERMNTLELGVDHPERDLYFSSKGHDCPGLYAVLHALGVISEDKLLRLRRFGGLHGHPDVGTPGIEANSGSLGMGVAKGRGMAWARELQGLGGHVTVMLGDGELQEGQIWESLQTTAHHRQGRLTVIIDHNKVQSDLPVSEVVSVEPLVEKFTAFGWDVHRVDGHDFAALDAALGDAETAEAGPRMVIADTIKGHGVSFMEHPVALETGEGLYPWHSGAPSNDDFRRAVDEIAARIDQLCGDLGVPAPARKDVTPSTDESMSLAFQNEVGEPVSLAARAALSAGVSVEYVAEAFGESLVELGGSVPELVVLDADLSADCRLRSFEGTYPGRFHECGIAEMDMVSAACGMASQGLLPVVSSFASFLASRANEQIYNALSEKRRIIFGLHYAGLIPAGPGKSHPSIRDISLLGALPNITIVQPSNAEQTRQAMAWAVGQADQSVALRLIIGPSPEVIKLPDDAAFVPGQGQIVADGDDGVIIAYGPVMLHEAMVARRLLAERGLGLRVVDLPWLNATDFQWLESVVGDHDPIWVLEDHAPVGGLADHLTRITSERGSPIASRLRRFAVEGWPACGTPHEALAFHRLDGLSLSERIAPSSGAARGRTAVTSGSA